MVASAEISAAQPLAGAGVRAKPRIMFLDALRFIAAGAVLLQHAVEREGELGQYIAGMLSPGVFGVVLFFLVSGFVIPMSARGSFSVPRFVVRRVFRIYPLVAATFLLLALLAYGSSIEAFGSARAATLRDWIANLLLVQDYVGAQPLWGVTWTLSLEATWYALFAGSLVVLGQDFDRKLSVVAPAILVALAIASIAIGHRLPLGRIGMVYAALLGCRAYRHYTGAISGQRFLVDTGVFIAASAICNVISFGHFTHPNITMYQAVIPWIVAPLLFAVATGLPTVRHSAIMNNGVLSWLGSISFSTYLLHPFAIGLAVAFVPSPYVLAASVLLTLLFSILGYHLVELPGQSLGKWVETRLPRRR